MIDGEAVVRIGKATIVAIVVMVVLSFVFNNIPTP